MKDSQWSRQVLLNGCHISELRKYALKRYDRLRSILFDRSGLHL